MLATLPRNAESFICCPRNVLRHCTINASSWRSFRVHADGVEKSFQEGFGAAVDKATVQSHYIFGYGSLICSRSRSLTAPETISKPAIPVLVSGLETVWAKRSYKLGMTAMGVRTNADASALGVILPVAEEDLCKFDDREKGYSRVCLEPIQVSPVQTLKENYLSSVNDQQSPLVDANDDDGRTKIWAYLPEKYLPANDDFPIVQSYVDTILRGCIDVGGEAFAKEFIQKTSGWDPQDLHEDSYLSVEQSSSTKKSFWVNDRENPIYTRGDAMHSRRNAEKFDHLLRACAGRAFAKRIRRE